MTQPELVFAASDAMDFAARQLVGLVERSPDYFPVYTSQGEWRHSGEAWTNWCEGFLGGQLWLLFLHTGDARWRRLAEHYSRLIEHRKDDRAVHDLGFLFWPSWKRWHDITGDVAASEIVVEAGRTLALRFQPAGKYLRSFVSADSLFIDIMMNVGIVFYAAAETDDGALQRIALEHCLTTRRCLVRGDGSTAHEGLFDLETGEFLRHGTHQGWRADSSWARGQAWALYGFTTAYEFCRDDRLLHTAEACADFYIERTPGHGVPPNDWDEPSPVQPFESSAAAIAASGLLDLAGRTHDCGRADRYRERAERILTTLCEPTFLARDTPGWEGILLHGSYHQGRGLGVDESVMWGDYFFLEALCKVLGDVTPE